MVAGLLISALGGSRFQIGGPTGAFVGVIFNVIAQHGYDGLILATLMAGIILTAAGYARLGTWIKYIPQPVVTGFTSGIAVIIFSSQIKDLFGLQIEKVPGEFFEKWHAFWAARETFTPESVLISVGAIAALILLKKYAPKLPAFLIAVVGASAVVWLFRMDVPTIGKQCIWRHSFMIMRWSIKWHEASTRYTRLKPRVIRGGPQLTRLCQMCCVEWDELNHGLSLLLHLSVRRSFG